MSHDASAPVWTCPKAAGELTGSDLLTLRREMGIIKSATESKVGTARAPGGQLKRALPRSGSSAILRDYGIYIMLVLITLAFSFTTKGFATINNLILILLQVSVMGILSVGMLFVILSKGIDLSVGSALAIAGMFSGLLAKQGPTPINIALALAVPLLLGLACGFLNGYLVSWGGLPPLIVTLGTMYAFRGFIVWYHVNPIYQLQPWYRVLGQEKVGPFPIPVIILLCVAGVSSLLLNRTRFGRYVYAVGGNEDAARAAGINVNLVKLCVYSISGFFCGLAGLVFTSRLGAAQSISGAGFEMVAIASVVVGGASLFGGRGTVGKTIVGALIMQIVQSGLVMLDVPSPIQQTILGFIIILAVWVDLFIQRKEGRKRSGPIQGLFTFTRPKHRKS
jgi:ribose/xylose/arabinose/galactoside ABC-type transport system permease subunit